jgi:hypothetical protein
MSTTGSLSEYARHIGASPSYVTKLKDQGRLVLREENGRQVVDFDLSDRLVRNTADMGRVRNGANASPGRAPSAPLAPVAESGRVDTIFRQAQAQERAYSAKLVELQYREAVGELVKVSDVRAETARLAAALRESILQLPARLTPVLAAESDPAKLHDLLERELHQVLAQLTHSEAKATAPA